MKKIMIALLLVPTLSMAQTPSPTGDGTWYYSVGGGDPYMTYSQSNRTKLNFGVSARWSMFNSCSFDPRASISDTFSDMQDNVYGLSQAVLSSAQTAVQSWGLQKIQENYPGLYDFLMKGLADAKNSFQVSVKSCQDYTRDLQNGRNPTDDWISAGVQQQWAQSEQDGENPVKADQEVKVDAANEGVAWVDGEQRGGSGQAPIETVTDTVRTGYQHITENDDNDNSDDARALIGQRITEIFEDESDAIDWVTSVVGEREIRTCTDCEKLRTRIGQGLRVQQVEEKQTAFEQLIEVMDAEGAPNREQLADLSVPGMGISISPSVIQALKAERRINQTILLNRLASEIALSRVMEKALVARDLLKMGSQEPNIAANQAAQKELTIARNNLNEEIDNVLYEHNIRSQLLTNTARTLSERQYQRSMDSRNILRLPDPSPDNIITEGGGIKRDN